MSFRPTQNALFFAILFGIALFFATYHLTESPSVWYDEGFYLQSAANLAQYGQAGLRLSPDFIEPSSKFISVGYPLIYPLALTFSVFGVEVVYGRALMVIFILGFLTVSYLFARRMFGGTCALLSLALLATFPPLYGNGKSVLGEVPGLFYLVSFFIFFTLARTASTRRYWWLAVAGFTAGLCVATKPTFILLLPAIAAGVFLEWRRGNITVKDLCVAASVGVLPIVYWMATQFQTGDSLGTILGEYANPYQIENLSAIIVQNLGRLFTDIGGLFLVVLMGIWTSALLIRIRNKRRVSSEEVIAFVFSLLTIAAYARTAGWYRYLFEAQTMALLFLPITLGVLWGALSERMAMLLPRLASFIPKPQRLVLLVGISLAVLGGYQILFDSWVAEAYQSHKTAFWEEYFRTLPPDRTLFFYDVPEVAFFASRDYYQYISPSGWPIGKEQLVVIEKGMPDIIVVRSDAYSGMKDILFKSYEIEQTAYKYSLLKKR